MKRATKAWTSIVMTALGCACSPVDAAEVRVGGRAALVAALAVAKGGQTFLLAPGDYGAVYIADKQFSVPIVITSANRAKPADLSEFSALNVQGVIVRSVRIGRALQPGEPNYAQLNSIASSKNISFEAIDFHGSMDGNPQNDGVGLYVRQSSGITIKASEFQQLYRAVLFEQTTDIKILDNRFHDIRSDAGDYAAVDNVIISGNRYSDFYPAENDHADAIQLWTNGQTRGSSNIVITNNEVLQGRGAGPQGFFIQDEVGNIPHKNVRIVNNLIYSSDQWEGISVQGVNGLEVGGNTVVSDPDDAKHLWIRIEKVDDADIHDNVADRLVTGNSTNVTEVRNLFLLDKPAESKLFPNLRARASATTQDLIVPTKGYKPAPSSATSD